MTASFKSNQEKLTRELEAERQSQSSTQRKLKELQRDLETINEYLKESETQVSRLDRENEVLRVKLEERNEMIAMIEAEVQNVRKSFAGQQARQSAEFQSLLDAKEVAIRNTQGETKVMM